MTKKGDSDRPGLRKRQRKSGQPFGGSPAFVRNKSILAQDFSPIACSTIFVLQYSRLDCISNLAEATAAKGRVTTPLQT
jgi:hypothetical protein